MSWVAWYIFLAPLTLLTILILWLKYTEWQIDKQYKERQDDE